MCVPGLDPVTLALTTALAAGGAAINGYEQNQTQKRMIEARNAATQAELQRQQKLQQQSQAVLDNTMHDFTPQSQADNLAQAQTASTNAFTANTPAVSSASFVTPDAPRVVQDAADKKVGDVFSRAGKLNTAFGNLNGYDRNFFNNNINLNNSARKLKTVSDFARTSAAVNGLEQQDAYNNAFRRNSGIGDLLSFAGNTLAYRGGRGGGFPSAAAPAAAAPFDITAGTGAVF